MGISLSGHESEREHLSQLASLAKEGLKDHDTSRRLQQLYGSEETKDTVPDG